jgi:hypothetical protein
MRGVSSLFLLSAIVAAACHPSPRAEGPRPEACAGMAAVEVTNHSSLTVQLYRGDQFLGAAAPGFTVVPLPSSTSLGDYIRLLTMDGLVANYQLRQLVEMRRVCL